MHTSQIGTGAVLPANYTELTLRERIAELEAALRPLVSAARKRQAHWSSQSGAVSDGEEASWLGKAEWWKRLADAGDAALTKST